MRGGRRAGGVCVLFGSVRVVEAKKVLGVVDW